MIKRAAFFDFDDTLIEGDSFLPFLGHARGKFRTTLAIVEALARLAWMRARGKEVEDRGTFIKGLLIHRLLSKQKVDDLHKAIEETREWRKIKTPMMEKLIEHQKNGDTIIIASGSLDLYLPALLRNVPYDALICTEVEVKDGVLTGVMSKGNCTRKRKAERVKEWLEANERFDETFGYGNAPHDLPMLDLMDNRTVV